jgi:hypothetical protein
VDVEPGGLWLSDSHSPVVGAAKRVFGIGDPLLLARRAADLAAAAEMPIAAFDLGLQNWARAGQGRLTGGSAQGEEPRADLVRPIASALRVAVPEAEHAAGADTEPEALDGAEPGTQP